MTWRVKSLPLTEWVNLQEAFGDLQMKTGGPESLAMFGNSLPGSDLSQIFIIGPGIDIIEALSPGGWQDAPIPTGCNLALLVGSGDPWEYFQIPKR